MKIVRYAQSGLASNADAFECDIVLVTADSLSMVTEAVAAGRPTLVISPDAYTGPRRDQRELEALQAQRLIARTTFGELGRETLFSPPFPPAQSRPAALGALLQTRGF